MNFKTLKEALLDEAHRELDVTLRLHQRWDCPETEWLLGMVKNRLRRLLSKEEAHSA